MPREGARTSHFKHRRGSRESSELASTAVFFLFQNCSAHQGVARAGTEELNVTQQQHSPYQYCLYSFAGWTVKHLPQSTLTPQQVYQLKYTKEKLKYLP